ncbi:MAG: FecR domain-containing protein [Acidobacteriaceae bacterium]|nr:FecR domain-containing protein [Acidobacteriaceae bacterium]
MRTAGRTAGIQALAAILFAAAAAGAQDPILEAYEAHATLVTGQVTRIRDEQPWAVSSGERVPVRQTITTGPDGFARFEVRGGSSFEVFANSRVVFRENTASAGDLLDVVSGRVRIHLQPTAGQAQQRVFCPVAIVSAHHQGATFAIAVDEDDTTRIDVFEGEVAVQHTLLPRNEPTLVRAVDAILVKKDEPISRRVDRGSLYRYTVKVLSAITFGRGGAHNVGPEEEERLLAASNPIGAR